MWSWVGDTLYSKRRGGHVYLNNSGMTSNCPQTTTYYREMNSDGEWIWATSILSENIEATSSICGSGKLLLVEQ